MIRMIFDATILLNMTKKDATRSGIFFCVKNVFDELRKRPDVALSLYFSPEHFVSAIDLKNKFAKDIPCVNVFSKFSFLLFVSKLFWNAHTKLFSHKFLRLPFALGIILSQDAIRLFYKETFNEEIILNSQFFFSPAKEIAKSIRKYPHLKFFTILHDAIPLLNDYMGRIEGRNHMRLIKSFGDRDYFFSNSEQTKRDFEKFVARVNSNTAWVVPHAASPEIMQVTDIQKICDVKAKYAIPQNKKYIFSLCTLEPRKNLFRAVETFCHFIEKHNITDLVWVLGGGHWEMFFKEMEKKNIQWNSESVIRTGYIDDEDRAALYSGAEWFVYTSRYEGFGVPPLEAMQCGCPVITSNNSSLPEVVGDAGIMIDWDSDEQHIEAYEKYYFNEDLRKKYALKGLERAKLFSWKKTVDKMIELMKLNALS